MQRTRRVVVTGGAGFIGSHVVDRLLAAGERVVVVDDLSTGLAANIPATVELLEMDLADSAAVDALVAIDAQAIIHCAAQTSVPVSFEDPLRDARSNILGSLALLEACRRGAIEQFVYVTTGGALYGRPMTVAWDEQAAVDPISPYGVSKSIVESYLAVLKPTPRTAVLRLANVYGPRQGASSESGVVAIFIDRMKRDLPVTIDGDGFQTRDLLFVADAVDAVEAVLQTGTSGTFNIGTGRGTTVNQVFAELAEQLRYGRDPQFGPERVGDIRHSALDPTKATASLMWQARTPLASGLAITIGNPPAPVTGTPR
jgi:UDP-glucose 4-epimerase